MPPILGAWDTTTQRDNNNNTTAYMYEAGLVAQRYSEADSQGVSGNVS